DTLRLPTSVLLPDKTVFVYDEATGTIASRTVETGISNWEFTEILGGIDNGDRVVSSIDRDGVVDGADVVPE
ncbi:MAG TPA: efflux RND transporter periplasmic adaptor subunit, partial [Gammaproteobacteria bacterium]